MFDLFLVSLVVSTVRASSRFLAVILLVSHLPELSFPGIWVEKDWAFPIRWSLISLIFKDQIEKKVLLIFYFLLGLSFPGLWVENDWAFPIRLSLLISLIFTDMIKKKRCSSFSIFFLNYHFLDYELIIIELFRSVNLLLFR